MTTRAESRRTLEPRDEAGSKREGVGSMRADADLRVGLPRGLRWARGPVERALGVTAAREVLDEVAHLDGEAFVNAVLASLRIEPAFAGPARGKVPATGPLVVVANHHFGGADALLALSLLLPIRPDLKLVANGALAVFPQLDGLVIPVPAPSVRRRRIEGVRDVVRHLRAGGAVLIFPAGRVAGRARGGRVEDHTWSPGVGRLVRMSRASVLPVAFEGGNGRSFHLARLVHFRLGTLLLLRELLNKAGSRIPMLAGATIPYAELSRLSDPVVLTGRLRRATYDLLPRRSGGC